jgi:hypothetical protein
MPQDLDKTGSRSYCSFVPQHLSPQMTSLQQNGSSFSEEELDSHCRKVLDVMKEELYDLALLRMKESFGNNPPTQMKVSKTLQMFSEELRIPVETILNNPMVFLGQNHRMVLEFWEYADKLNDYDYDKLLVWYLTLMDKKPRMLKSLEQNAMEAADKVVGYMIRGVAWRAAKRIFISLATLELIADLPKKTMFEQVMNP